MSAPAPAISVRGVSKRYRLYHERNSSLKAAVMRGRRARYTEFDALKDVTFDVPAGSTFGLIGENGSGKSTLLKCMAKILRPDAGEIRTEGKISALLELGAGFHPELSGRENVYLNGAILGLTKKQLDARFDDIVDFAGIHEFIDSPVKNYSSGMYLRLGFSVAINVEPDILLVDEILAVGDEQFQRKCSDKFVSLRQQGKTIVIVSHALESIRSMCDQVALLEHGELRALGPAADVIDQYLGDVHTEAIPDGHGLRWGSGEARVERIELLGPDGRPTTQVRTGDPVVFRLHYRAHEPIDQPVFGLSLYNIDGFMLTNPNMREMDAVPERIEGTGHVDFVVPRLLLVPGAYDLGAALVDFSLTQHIDVRVRAFRFDVEPGHPHESVGVLSLGGEWREPVVSTDVPAEDDAVAAP